MGDDVQHAPRASASHPAAPAATVTRDAARRAGPEPSRVWALRVAGVSLAAMAATWALAELVPAIHLRDAVVLNDFTKLDRPGVAAPANALLHLLDPLLYTLWALLLIVAALLRARPRVAVAVALVVPATPLAAEALKPLLAHSHDPAGLKEITAASWPSGHAATAMTLVLCSLLVAPRRLRPLVAVLGSAFAVAVGGALLILAWHMPSDVLGGYLLATLCVSLAVAAIGAAWDEPGPRERPVRAGGGPMREDPAPGSG